MAYLINNIEDLRRHLTLSASFDFAKVLAYSKRAERKFLIAMIGKNQYDIICGHEPESDAEDIISEVKYLLEESAANYALLLAAPFLNIFISNTGLKKTENTNSSNADWKDIRDMKRNFSETAGEALDSALELMESHVSDFPEWASSDNYTVFKKFLVRHTADFDKYFDIRKNRKTFLALKPYMYEVEEQYLLSMLGKCTLDQVKSYLDNEVVIRVQELLQKAIVALTVAKVAVTGRFVLTPSSLFISTEELPWERTTLGLTPENQENLRRDRQNAGEEYLKKVKKKIKENPELFPCYEDKEERGLLDKIIVKKSHISL